MKKKEKALLKEYLQNRITKEEWQEKKAELEEMELQEKKKVMRGSL